MKISIEEIRSLLVGKVVNISHEGSHLQKGNSTGLCIAVHKIDSEINIELESGGRWALLPDSLTNKSVEGTPGTIRGRRKIELADSEQIIRKQFWVQPTDVTVHGRHLYGPWNSEAELSTELETLGFTRMTPHFNEVLQSSDGSVQLEIIRTKILPPYKLTSLLP